MSKATKIVLFVVLPVLVLSVAITLILLPIGLKKYVNEHGSEYSGRKTFVRDIKIDYLSTTISILDFKILEADGQSTFISFDTLQVAISPFPLISSKLVVEKIHLVRPYANIVRKDSLYNFDDILKFVSSKPKENSAEKPASTFQYMLKNIVMEQGKLIFADNTVGHTTTFNDLRFSIPSLSFNQDEVKDAGIKLHFENGGSFAAKADYNQRSGAYKVDLSIDKLDLGTFLPYAKSYLKISTLAGLVKGDFHLAGTASNLDSVLFRGKGEVADFSANDNSNRKVIGVKSAKVSFRDSYPMKYDYRFDSIGLDEPWLFVEMKDSTLNLLNLMVESPADTVPFTYFYSINQLRIDRGMIDLRDNSYEEPFDYQLSDIEMKVDSVSSTSKWVDSFATMRLNKRGKLQAELGINPSDPYELKVNYVISNFQLTDLNIYSKHFVGYPILLGNMYYKGKTVIKGKQLSSENKLIIRNASLGKKSGGLMNLPLKLAVYLLKDIHGDIILDLPLTGDLNNPKTKVGKLIWQVLKNVVVKVVASPFMALGGLVGVDPTEVKGIEFNYADSTLTPAHLRRIKLYTELEKKKPDMKMELSYFNDDSLERNELAKVIVGAHKIDSLQQCFSKARIRKIEEALKSADDSTKIKIVIPPKASPENVGSRPVFELKYSVEE